MPAINDQLLVSHQGEWSVHGVFCFAEGNTKSLEGLAQTQYSDKQWSMRLVHWVLAKENPYKATLTMHTPMPNSSTQDMAWSGEHSLLGPVQGGIVLVDYGLVIHYGASNAIGSEHLFIEGDSYRGHGLITRDGKKIAAWSALYKIQK